MIFIADAANGHSLSWLQDLDRASRHSGGNTDFQKTLAAEELPTTQITIEVGKGAKQQETRNALMAQGSAKVAGAATMLARAQSYFKEQLEAQKAAQSEELVQASDPAQERGTQLHFEGEFTYQNDEGELVTTQVASGDITAMFEGALTQEDLSKALLSVLNSLVFGTPLSEEAKKAIQSEDSFAGLLGINPDELKYAQNNSSYVLDTPLGKMTYQDLKELSKRVYNYVQYPTFTTRSLALNVMQDIAERQDELERQYAQQTPFEEIQQQQKQQLAAAGGSDESAQAAQDEQEQVDELVQAKVEHLEEQHDIQAQVRKLHAADHEADQDFLNTLKFSYDLLRS